MLRYLWSTMQQALRFARNGSQTNSPESTLGSGSLSMSDDLVSPHSMLEFELGLMLNNLICFLTDPEAFLDEDDCEHMADNIINGIIEAADNTLGDWFEKYGEEFDDWCNAD